MRIYPRFHKSTNEVNHLLLLSLINSGSVCADKTLEENIMTLRAEIIAKHEKHHSIWQNKSTLKWCTKLGEEKRLLMRKERSDLENANDYKRFLGKTEFASRPIHDITEQDIVRLTKAIVYDVEKILDAYVFVNAGRVVEQGMCDTVRQETGKSLDEHFREVFRCYENR